MEPTPEVDREVDRYRRRLLAAHAARVGECAQRTIAAAHRRTEVLGRAALIERTLLAPA